MSQSITWYWVCRLAVCGLTVLGILAACSAPPEVISSATPTPDKPHIDFFTASPSEVDPGGTITFKWKATGDEFALSTINPDGRMGNSSRVVAEGTTTRTAGRSGTFYFFATSGDKSVSSMVRVKIRCADTWFLDNPPLVCPSNPPTDSDGLSQHFEHGWMLRVGSSKMIYVLFDHGSPGWDTYRDEWQPGMSESDPLTIPPAGFYQPVRGFGLLWRMDAGHLTSGLREQLGWAIEPEVSYPTACQCESTYYSSCFLKAPEGKVIRLKPELTGWEILGGPATPTRGAPH